MMATRRLIICSSLLIWNVIVSAAIAVEEHTLQAGAAAVEISPEKLPALWNGGFLQKSSNRVLDPLHARALVLSDNQETIAIVIVDSCMFPTTLCDEIKRIAMEKSGIPTDRILISATHTHSAPSAMTMCLGCDQDEAYVNFVPERVAQAIATAHENLQPAKLGWAVVDGTDLTHCRRWITRSDRMGTDPFGRKTVRAMMHPGYQNSNYTSPAGPIDPWLSVLSVVSANDATPICVMANLSMHYFGGGGFSADYFGEVARLLEVRLAKLNGKRAPGFVGIMSQGTSGDLHWMDYSQPRREINRQQYASEVANRILAAWKSIAHSSHPSIAMAEKRLTIERRTPSKARLEWARPINAGRLDQSPRNQVEVYAQQADWIHHHPTAEVVLQAIRIGQLGITAMPNEVYGITGLKLKRQSPLADTFNLELANGATGYIPPPEQHRLGGYTTWPARTAGLSEQAEPRIVETLLSLLEKISAKQRRSIPDPVSPYSEAIQLTQPIAYYRLHDMDSALATNAMGKPHAQYRGGVALFLPGPSGSGFSETKYGNRSVYLAGGHVEASWEATPGEYSATLWFCNMLPTDARDVTGILLSTETETLLISGSEAGDQAGKLMLRSGNQSFTGKTSVTTKHWQQVTITRNKKRVRVYLDGRTEPEIDTSLASPPSARRLLIGSDGKSANTFDGKIAELAIYDREMKAEEIANLYQTSGVPSPPQPQPEIILGPKPSDAKARQRYADAVLASKPIAFWRLHDESKASAKDTMGQFPAHYERGAGPRKPQTSIPNFTGGRVKTQVAKLGDTYSVELWFRNELAVNSRPVTAYLFSRAVDGVDGAAGDNLGIGGTHSNRGQLIVFNGNERNQLAAGPTQIKRGSWTYVVMTRVQQRITVYLNGNPTPEIVADLPAAWPPTCDDILLGGRSDNFANLQGMLEEVALYDRALTPAEVKSHFSAAEVKRLAPSATTQTRKPTPTDVSQALGTIHVRDGFAVELVAAEPLVMDPVAIDWGPDGKLWVVEMADYPLGMDGQGKPGGRVRFLEDTDRDGRYDKSTLFAAGLSFPNGILTWGRGVLVTAAPEIVYLEDSTGDGKADVRRVLYSGFLEGNQQLRVNGLRWGLDNWIYCASGSHHGGYGKDSKITSHLTGEKYQVGSRDFRIRPNSGDIDAQSGPSQFGRNRDDWGHWFGVQNSHPLWHYVLADHNIRRNPHFAPPDPKQQVITPANPPVFPASTLQKRYHSFDQSGRFTSACSAMIYRDAVLFNRGPEQHAFVCEPFHNLVQHNLITNAGVSFGFRRDPAEKKIDFFASEDRWCRPVMTRTGPDGALWVVDMYRYMIEHPQWLPRHGQDELKPWYRSGDDRGRIYRIVRRDQPTRTIPRLEDLSAQQLVAVLNSPNGWQRDTAQRLLVSENQTGAIEPLRKMSQDAALPQARLHALWTLDGLAALSSATLENALIDIHPGVRRNAVQIAARVRVDSKQLAALVDDPSPKVRLELASTLGAYHAPQTNAALAELIINAEENRYLLAAAMSSLNSKNVATVLHAVLRSSNSNEATTSELIRQAIAWGNQEAIGNVVKAVCTSQNGFSQQESFAALATLLDGLASRQWATDQLSESISDRITTTIQQARIVAAEPKHRESLRVAAIGLLGRETKRQTEDLELLRSLLVPQSPVALQRAVVTHLGKRTEAKIADTLLSGWNSHGPEIRMQILGLLASRGPWSESLRKRLESGTILASELSIPIRQQLLERSKNDPSWQRALASPTTNRAKVLQAFQPALQLQGDAARGSIIFRKTCLNCHQLQNQGHAVGPQLASITNKTKEALLTAIIDPNAAVDARYFSYSIVTTDGQILAGQMETETATSITLLAAGGKRETVLRRDIEVLRASMKSVMPEGLEEGLKSQDIADLIQFVRETIR